MRICLETYMDKNKTVDITNIRHFVDKRYMNEFQEDVAEFTYDLVQKINNVFTAINFKRKYTITCLNNKCSFVNECNSEDTIFVIPSTSFKNKKNITLQELINTNKIQKYRTNDSSCNNCGNKTLLHKTELHSVGKIIILQLELFEKNSDQIS